MEVQVCLCSPETFQNDSSNCSYSFQRAKHACCAALSGALLDMHGVHYICNYELFIHFIWVTGWKYGCFA